MNAGIQMRVDAIRMQLSHQRARIGELRRRVPNTAAAADVDEAVKELHARLEAWFEELARNNRSAR